MFLLALATHSQIHYQQLKFSTNSSIAMFKQVAASLVLVVLGLDPTKAQDIAPSTQHFRVTDSGRKLEATPSSLPHGALANPLYEANVSIPGCKWYEYFYPWSCCGTNSCKGRYKQKHHQ
ncbi:hypothetical protein DD238_007383 [Peronospora effusa]|uniref:Uncharacterized protein n=1 Tax=Peronospora effusa TaxID=542832 RepID=A0A3M6VAZ4_9STRA|nr:hypothetical protein DD238_007383 [Peronospora effusa]